MVNLRSMSPLVGHSEDTCFFYQQVFKTRGDPHINEEASLHIFARVNSFILSGTPLYVYIFIVHSRITPESPVQSHKLKVKLAEGRGDTRF
jgi:hypothetical protein